MNRLLLALGMISMAFLAKSQELIELQLFRGNDTPNGSGELTEFGTDIDISGNFAVIGAPNPGNLGAAYVFEFNGTQWTEVAKLTASDQASGDEFGSCVSIDGDVIVVGARFRHETQMDAGAAYIFEKPIAGWANTTETAKFISPNEIDNGNFGFKVDLIGDELMISAPGETINQFGRIYMYGKTSGSSWTTGTLLAELTTTVGSFDYLGVSAVFEGDFVVSGAGTGSGPAGTAHIFEKGASWTNSTDDTRTILQQNRSTGDQFGTTMAVSDKYILGVSTQSPDNAPTPPAAGPTPGNRVHVFIKPGANWSDGPDSKEDDYSINIPVYANFPIYTSQIVSSKAVDMAIIDDLVLIGSGRSMGPESISEGSVFLYDLGNSLADTDSILTIHSSIDDAFFGSSISNNAGNVLISSPGETEGGVVRYFKLQYSESITQTLCPGDAISFGTQSITSEGIYNETFTASNGIDSLVALTVVSPLLPDVVNASSVYGSMTSSGLELTLSNVDEISTHFRIDNISGGSLFKNDGTTVINDGEYIDLIEGGMGLKFLPDEAQNGSFEVEASVGTDGSCLSSSETPMITVSKADITVTPNDKSITYGDAIPNFDGVLAGVVNNDNITADYQSASDGTIAGNFDIIATLVDPDNRLVNYNVTNTDGTLTINKATLIIEALDITISEEEEIPTLEMTYDGFISGEDESVLNTPPTISTDAVEGTPGTYTITLSGGSDDNYSFSLINGTLNIENVLGFSGHHLEIYPNPTQSYIQVDGRDIEKISIFDAEGRELSTWDNQKIIDISGLKSGVYIIQIQMRSGSSVSRRLIKR
ncbi:MBG domain-containing protein [Ekhidna sp.]